MDITIYRRHKADCSEKDDRYGCIDIHTIFAQSTTKVVPVRLRRNHDCRIPALES